jgi:tetratricopeptide (TPR) repeat protein
VIKGSWEDLLQQAHRLASNQNDDAVAAYEKVIHGVHRLSDTQRQANKARLQELLKAAVSNLHVYLTSRERYEEALALFPQLYELSNADERSGWQQREGLVLAQAGRNEEALAQMQRLTATPETTLTDWGNLVSFHVRQGHFAQAGTVLEAATQWQAMHSTTSTDGEKPEAYFAYLRSLVALESGRYADSIADFEAASALDAAYKERPYLLYARLMFNRQTELALPFIQRDTRYPVRAGFWHGVALRRLGRNEEAKRQWEKVIKAVSPQTNNEEFAELVLTFYYLGDPEGRGLGGVLRALQSGGVQSWLLFFLAGLGWALRTNLTNARTNFALALARRRAGAEGSKLSPEVWQYCQELLPAETQAELIEYFTPEKSAF